MNHFPRKVLAREFIKRLRGSDPIHNYSSGLFLTAPRRTGKTMFLRHDLSPELESTGVVVIYVDLWSNTNSDPGELIAEAIRKEADKHLSFIARTAKSAGLREVKIAGALTIDTSQIGRSGGATLTDALKFIHEAAKKPIALIVDEAQQALFTAEGMSAMTALKSARDQMNSPGQVNLMLVMSGSDRDKLARLVNGNSSPFLGSQIRALDPLGDEFIEHVANTIERNNNSIGHIDRGILKDAFKMFGNQPEVLLAKVSEASDPLSGQPNNFNEAVLFKASEFQRAILDELESDFLGMTLLEQTVFAVMLEQGEAFKPYGKTAMDAYAKVLGNRPEAHQVQDVLNGLVSRDTPLAWKSYRGTYVVDNQATISWFINYKAAGNWPPADEMLGLKAKKAGKSKVTARARGES